MKQIFKWIKELFTFRGIVSNSDAISEPCKAVFSELESVKKEIDNRKNSDLPDVNRQIIPVILPKDHTDNFKYESPVQKVAENYVSKSEIVLKEDKKKEIELFKKSDNEPKKKRRYNKKKH